MQSHPTNHDFTPTHPMKPQYYLDALAEDDAAQQAWDDATEDGGVRPCSAVFDQISARIGRAHEAVSDAYNRWQNELAAMLEPDGCTCVLPEQSCPACRKAAAAGQCGDDELPYEPFDALAGIQHNHRPSANPADLVENVTAVEPAQGATQDLGVFESSVPVVAGHLA